MKKFLSGFLVGAIIFSAIGAFSVSYVANPVDFKVLVNGKEFTSDPPALEIDGRTYLPLRAIGEALGVPVNWNEYLYQAEIGSAGEKIDTSKFSRKNPAPINTVQQWTKSSNYNDSGNYTSAIRIIETERGEAAYKHLKEKYYPAPEEGYEYMNVKIACSLISTKEDFSVDFNLYDFDSYTSNNEKCPTNYRTSLEPSLDATLYEGGNGEGWITIMVKKDDPSPKLVYGLNYDGTGGIWFSLN